MYFKSTSVFDLQEALEACQTRISKMELQQQQQQVVQLEGLENATARTLLGKLINVLLAVMAVLLVFVSTVANCVVPLMKTRSRTLSTLLLVILLAFLWRHWDAISDYLHHFLLHPRWPADVENEEPELFEYQYPYLFLLFCDFWRLWGSLQQRIVTLSLCKMSLMSKRARSGWRQWFGINLSFVLQWHRHML